MMPSAGRAGGTCRRPLRHTPAPLCLLCHELAAACVQNGEAQCISACAAVRCQQDYECQTDEVRRSEGAQMRCHVHAMAGCWKDVEHAWLRSACSQLLASRVPPYLPAYRPAEGHSPVRPGHRNQPLRFHHVPGRHLLPKVGGGGHVLCCAVLCFLWAGCAPLIVCFGAACAQELWPAPAGRWLCNRRRRPAARVTPLPTARHSLPPDPASCLCRQAKQCASATAQPSSARLAPAARRTPRLAARRACRRREQAIRPLLAALRSSALHSLSSLPSQTIQRSRLTVFHPLSQAALQSNTTLCYLAHPSPRLQSLCNVNPFMQPCLPSKLLLSTRLYDVRAEK